MSAEPVDGSKGSSGISAAAGGHARLFLWSHVEEEEHARRTMVRLYEHAADHEQSGGYGGEFYEAGVDRLETLPRAWKDRVTTIAIWPHEAIRIWPDDAGRGEGREYYYDAGRAREQGGSKLKEQVGKEVLLVELHRDDHGQYEFHGRGGGGWNDVVNSFHTFRPEDNVPWPERSDWEGGGEKLSGWHVVRLASDGTLRSVKVDGKNNHRLEDLTLNSAVDDAEREGFVLAGLEEAIDGQGDAEVVEVAVRTGTGNGEVWSGMLGSRLRGGWGCAGSATHCAPGDKVCLTRVAPEASDLLLYPLRGGIEYAGDDDAVWQLHTDWKSMVPMVVEERIPITTAGPHTTDPQGALDTTAPDLPTIGRIIGFLRDKRSGENYDTFSVSRTATGVVLAIGYAKSPVAQGAVYWGPDMPPDKDVRFQISRWHWNGTDANPHQTTYPSFIDQARLWPASAPGPSPSAGLSSSSSPPAPGTWVRMVEGTSMPYETLQVIPPLASPGSVHSTVVNVLELARNTPGADVLAVYRQGNGIDVVPGEVHVGRGTATGARGSAGVRGAIYFTGQARFIAAGVPITATDPVAGGGVPLIAPPEAATWRRAQPGQGVRFMVKKTVPPPADLFGRTIYDVAKAAYEEAKSTVPTVDTVAVFHREAAGLKAGTVLVGQRGGETYGGFDDVKEGVIYATTSPTFQGEEFTAGGLLGSKTFSAIDGPAINAPAPHPSSGGPKVATKPGAPEAPTNALLDDSLVGGVPNLAIGGVALGGVLLLLASRR